MNNVNGQTHQEQGDEVTKDGGEERVLTATLRLVVDTVVEVARVVVD